MKSLGKFMMALTVFTLAGALTGLAEPADSEILATVKAIDQHEIDAANTALDKNPSPEVRDFAQKMQTEHMQNMNELNAVAQEENLSVTDTAAVTAFKTKAKAKELTLKPFTGGAFEKMYIDAMVSGHQDALDKLDKDLIPQAKSEKVKDFLNKTRSSVSTHLDHAKKIQADLNNRKN